MERSNPHRAKLVSKMRGFGPVFQTLENIKPVGYKWAFMRKRNENNDIIRYKAWLVQGFLQKPVINYEENYSPVMDTIKFWYLISLIVSKGLDMCLMDVITTYLYGSINTDIYMKILEGFKLLEND